MYVISWIWILILRRYIRFGNRERIGFSLLVFFFFVPLRNSLELINE